jgi:hypothetical protein
MMRKLTLFVGAVAALAIGHAVSREAPSASAAAPVSAPRPVPVSDISSNDYSPQVTLSDFQWRAGGFGSVMVVDFKLTSTAPVEIRKVLVACTAAAGNGTALGTSTELFHVALTTGKSHVVKGYSMQLISQQVARAGCRVIRATV